MKKSRRVPQVRGADIVRVPGGVRSTMDSTQNFVIRVAFGVLRWTAISAVAAAFPRNGCGRKIWKKLENTGRKRPNERNFMELTSKQRAQLRGLANTIDTIIHVGKDGIGENLIKQADDALEARELIKGRVLGEQYGV